MNVLAIDIGGTHVKILATGQTERAEVSVSGPTLTPEQMVAGVKQLAGDWKYDVVSIGYPGPVCKTGRSTEPHNLAPGLGRVRLRGRVRTPRQARQRRGDAGARQLQGREDAVPGSGHRPRLGADRRRHVVPMELGHLPYRKRTYEDYVGLRGLEKLGQEEVAEARANVVDRLVAALEPDDVVLGGGNVKKLKELPPGCRLGDNANAFLGGFRLWEAARTAQPKHLKRRRHDQAKEAKGSVTMTAVDSCS